MRLKLGVIVARLQVAELHAGHRHLIESVLASCDAVLICIGDRDKVAGARNPLPYSARAAMVAEHYGESIAVRRLADHPDDRRWSERLDALIRAEYPLHDVTLYCSRDGFSDYYSGAFPVHVIAEAPAESGTQQRARILADLKSGNRQNADFRRGMIAAAASRYPIVFSTVDVAVMDGNRSHLWLGQKHEDNGRWRFVGGFVDPTDTSRAAAAIREAEEELGGIRLDNPTYVGSLQVNDFRYRDEADSIMTDLFIVTHTWGQATASDDLDAIGWFPLSQLPELLIPCHQPLGALLLRHLSTKGTL